AQLVAGAAALGDPQVVPLRQKPRFGDVGGVDAEAARVVDIAEADAHAALGPIADLRWLAEIDELLAAVVGVELVDAVIDGQDEIGITGAAQVGGRGGEDPARAADAHLRGDILEAEPLVILIETAIAQKIPAAAVLGVLEALGHDLGRLEVPQIHIVGPVAADEEVEQPV